MKKLTKDEMKNVKGGTQDPPAGCYCFTPNPQLPFNGVDPDCHLGSDSDLYCSGSQILVCC